MKRISPLIILGAAAAIVMALLKRPPTPEAPEPDWKPVSPS